MTERSDITVDPIALLTPRERECLGLVDQHLSSKQIARQLGMSKTSVDTYCDRARRKLGVEDRYTAARLVRGGAVNPVLTGSGQDAIRTDSRPDPWPYEGATREQGHERPAELRESSGDRTGASAPSGDRRLRDPLADIGLPGGNDPGLFVGAAGAAMARHLVSATRKLAPFKPSEMVLREILCMTWVLLDENFRPDAEPGSAEMI